MKGRKSLSRSSMKATNSKVPKVRKLEIVLKSGGRTGKVSSKIREVMVC